MSKFDFSTLDVVTLKQMHSVLYIPNKWLSYGCREMLIAVTDELKRRRRQQYIEIPGPEPRTGAVPAWARSFP